LGVFQYRHIQPRLFRGYETVAIQQASCMLALPEKALLDLFYFHNGPATDAWIQ